MVAPRCGSPAEELLLQPLAQVGIGEHVALGDEGPHIGDPEGIGQRHQLMLLSQHWQELGRGVGQGAAVLAALVPDLLHGAIRTHRHRGEALGLEHAQHHRGGADGGEPLGGRAEGLLV